MVNRDELACSYSALILTDSGVDISTENIKKLLKAANVTVDALWPTLFAKAVKNINVRELLDSASSASPVAAAPITATAVPTQAAAPDSGKAAKEEKKEESEEEDDDMGFGLFD